jgi:hypothetical protein
LFPQVVDQQAGGKEDEGGFHLGIMVQGEPLNQKSGGVGGRMKRSDTKGGLWIGAGDTTLETTGPSGGGIVGKKDGQLRLQRRWGSRLLSWQQTASFREGLLPHEGGKLLKREHGFVHPFDGNLLEDPLLMPDHKDLPRRINA